MSIVVFLLGITFLIVGYKLYGTFLSHLVDINQNNLPPAIKKNDGVDFVPAKNKLALFGHHFSSIAGAGPIIGPILAYLWWGWIGVFLWILLGTIFIGAVHDFLSLVISVREDGKTIGYVAERYISRSAGKVFLLFLWFTLIFVVAIFAAICTKSFIQKPAIILPSLGIIPLALLLGWLNRKFKISSLTNILIIIFSLTLLILISTKVSFQLNLSFPFLLIIIFGYAAIASILPVDILLQPRDYICSIFLFFGIATSAIGIFLHPQPVVLQMPKFFSPQAGPLFPMMFITVACGAISGFHSLVSSGTTSKQICSETDMLPIGFGAMILEAVLALTVLCAVAFNLKDIPANLPAPEVYSQAYAKITPYLGGIAGFIALIILNSFILTTLDTATRITRLITQELTGVKSKVFATLVVVFIAAYFSWGEKWQTLWPLFGAANQLVAALALLVIAAWLKKHNKVDFIVIIPAGIMLIVTISALIIKFISFLQKGNLPLILSSFALILLAIFVVKEYFFKIIKNTSN